MTILPGEQDKNNRGSVEAGIHDRFMRMALSLARRGTGSVSPNPMVGCVIVDWGKIPEMVSYGYHGRCGGPHAEAEALLKAGGAAKGKTVYVNLEPCCHTGRTPPCCDALIRAGVSRVIVGTLDPNPLVAGGGVKALREAGIEVITGILGPESKWLNRGFIRRVAMGRPWVTVKAAISMDGNIALSSGESKWITNEASRKRAHLLRAESDAVMVGIGTVKQDDPALTVRDTGGKNPLCVVVDRDLEIDPGARVLQSGCCTVFTGPKANPHKKAALEDLGARLVPIGLDENGRMPVAEMLFALAGLGVNRLLVEGGAGLIGSFLRAGAADELSLFVAPKIMGGGLNFAGGISFGYMREVIEMKSVRSRMLGCDIWYEGVPSCSPDL